MLYALKIHLKTLSIDPSDPFTQHVRDRVGAREAVRFEQPLRNMILVVPDMVAQIRAWMVEPGMPPQLRQLHGFALAYLYNPEDLLPEQVHGLFGYLDDAYFVASVFQRTMTARRGLRNGESWGKSKIAEQLPSWINLTKELLPKETTQIDQIIDDLHVGRDEGLLRALGCCIPKTGSPANGRGRLSRR